MALNGLEAHKKGKKHTKTLELLADSQGAPLPGLTNVKGRPFNASVLVRPPRVSLARLLCGEIFLFSISRVVEGTSTHK